MKYFIALLLTMVLQCGTTTNESDIIDGELIKVASGFKFLEGPCADTKGNMHFSDILNNSIHRWTTHNTLDTLVYNTNWGNGIYINKNGYLWQCEIKGKQITRYKTLDSPEPLIDEKAKTKLNGPNDIWLMPHGGIYFSDPDYSQKDTKSIEAVYYLPPNSNTPVQVTFDLLRPNGLVGTQDGKKLYITDHKDNRTWVYKPNKDGTLAYKQLFAKLGGDGLTLDNRNNVYITNLENASIDVFNASGVLLTQIKVPETPSNVAFGGKNGHTLFITARTSLYAIKLKNKGQPKAF